MSHLSELFPVPSFLPPSAHSPRILPGVSPESTATLCEVMQDNHKRWHVFFDEIGRHNHTTHHMLAIWALGANADVIRAAYASNCSYQRAAFQSPSAITKENFKNHVGDQRYYNAFLHFFGKVIKEKGVSATLEEYVFSTRYNFDPDRDPSKPQPEMLTRLLDAIVHPMIHVGYGLELGIPGMVVEGLASAAVHRAGSTLLIPSSFFEAENHSVAAVASRMRNLLPLNATHTTTGGLHAFTIIGRMTKDKQFDSFRPSAEFMTFREVMQQHGQAIKAYADQWAFDASNPETVQNKVEELIWTYVILYGIGGWKNNKFQADFFYMHFVTSAIFFHSFLPYLTPRSQCLLLQAHFAVCLGWWVGHGRAGPSGLGISGFFAADTAYPIPPGPHPLPLDYTFPDPKSPLALTPNPWLPIIQSTIVHLDEHLPKLIRALAHFSTIYGNRTAGMPDFANTELDGADKLDGTLFVRVAGLTAKYMGRTRDGEKPALFKEGEKPTVAIYWAREPFFNS